MNYFYDNKLKKSKAYDFFDKSGECWCGAFSHPWELKMLEKHDPLTFETIRWLEKELMIHGTDHAKLYARWGQSEGTTSAELQTTLETFTKELEVPMKVNDDYCGESCDIEPEENRAKHF